LISSPRSTIGRVLAAISRLSVALILLFSPLLLHGQVPPFAIVGDTHVGQSGSAYEQIITLIDREGIHTIVHLGDAIDRPGSAVQWAEFLRITGTGKTLYLIPGNHDVDSQRSLAVYLRLFQKPYYSISEGDTLLVMLNTELPGEQAKITGQQYVWLQDELRRPYRYKFVFLHQPLFSVFLGHGLDKHREERDRLHRLFIRSGVSLVVSGHDHVYDRGLRDGITYVIASGGGGRRYLPAPNGAFLHYVAGRRVDAGYSFVVKDITGETKDRFSIFR
jgi:3',5'-cyclic AMP phosphodiesterase CpdA